MPGHLNFCLNNGQQQLDLAVEAFKGLGISRWTKLNS